MLTITRGSPPEPEYRAPDGEHHQADDRLSVAARATARRATDRAAYDPIPGESLLGLDAGERMSARDLLYGLLLPSGNDAAATLADGAAGSTPSFVIQMNRTARRLGLRRTSYANPIGLDQPGNYSSPSDLAALALASAGSEFSGGSSTRPEYAPHRSHPRTIVNHNDLVGDVPWINGVKTGYTAGAGNVLVGSGTRKGVTLLSVVMGAASAPGTTTPSPCFATASPSIGRER